MMYFAFVVYANRLAVMRNDAGGGFEKHSHDPQSARSPPQLKIKRNPAKPRQNKSATFTIVIADKTAHAARSQAHAKQAAVSSLVAVKKWKFQTTNKDLIETKNITYIEIEMRL